MKNIVSFMIIMETVYRAAGVLTNKTTTSVCQGLTATIDFSINLQGSTYGTESESWYFGSTRIATNPSGTFSPQVNYSSRLSSYSTYGISLSGVTSTDAGEYLLVFAVIAPTFVVLTATASLTVNIAPASSCVPYYSPTGGTYKCVLNQTAVSNNECGSPILQTNWTNGLGTSDINIATSGNYTCCAYSIAKNCYSGSYTFCETFSITGTTTTTTIAVTSSFLSSTLKSSTFSSATTDNKSTKPTTNKSAVSARSSTFTSISTTTVLPPNDTNNTSTTRSPTITGSTVIVTSSTSASTSSTAVSHANNTSNISTSANPTAAEPTAITKTSTDNNGTKSNISDTDIKVIVPAVVVPCGLLIIVALVLIVVFCVRRKAGKNFRESPDGMAVQDKCNNIDGWKQSLGHGKATDNLDTVYNTHDGFIIYPGPAAISTAGSYKDKKYHVVTDQYSRPYPDTYGNQSVYFSSTYKSVRTYAEKGKTYEGHQLVSNPMANSRLANDLTVCYPQTGYYGQIDDKLNRKPTFTKSKTNNSGPRTFHTSTLYKVEPKTINKQTDDRKQPVPPVNTGFKDTPTFRQLPQPPQNGEIKDQSLPGRSATIDDTPGLANETSRNNILPPLPLKQETLQEENASEKHKKKRKKKKKEDQMNVETPEEGNGETDMRVN